MNQRMEGIAERLRQWSEESGIVEKALENCKVSLANCAEEDKQIGEQPLKGWELEQIRLEFDKQSLVFKHGILSYPYIDTEIGLYVDDPEGIYFRHLKPIGSYRLITTLDGEVNDDYLVLDEWADGRRARV